MAIINAGRSIIYASRGEDFARAAREAAIALRDEMNTYRLKYFPA
jgi:orotidine-5'-phosphate decarboxylase